MNRSHSQFTAVAVLLASANSLTLAQDYPVEAVMRYESWDGFQWTSYNQGILSGSLVEWRIVVSYTGPRTDLFALGRVHYETILSNADNTGAGPNADQFLSFLNNGVQGNSIPGSMLTQADGHNSDPRSDGYGRTNFGALTRTFTTHRHSAGSFGAPPGEWMRIAPTSADTWPAYPLTGPPGADQINRLQNLTLTASQASLALTNPANLHTAGTTNIVIFRGAMRISADHGVDRLELTSLPGVLQRAGGASSSDDRRYMTWQIGNTDNGGYRTGVVIQPLIMDLNIPAPGAIAPFAGFLPCCSRRTRKGPRP